MKGSGKIGSVLATFEDNIAKNQEYQNETGGTKSFLTTVAVGCHTPKTKFQSILKKKIIDTPTEIEYTDGQECPASQQRSNIFISKYISDLPYGSCHGEDQSCLKGPSGSYISPKKTSIGGNALLETSFTTVSVSDEESALSSIQPQQPRKTRVVRKIAIIRPNSNGNHDFSDTDRCHDREQEFVVDSPTKSSIKLMMERSSQYRKISLHSPSPYTIGVNSHRRNALADVPALSGSNSNVSTTHLSCRSPGPDKESLSIQNVIRTPLSGAQAKRTLLLQKSPLEKIAATIKRVNSSNSFREASQSAAATTKSTSSKSSGSKKSKSRKKLTDHVNQSPPSTKTKYNEKSITSLPITSAVSTARQESFLSLPLSLSTSPHTSKGITIAARRSSINKTVANLEAATHTLTEKLSLCTSNQSITNSTIPLETLGSSISDTQEVNMEYGPCDASDQPIDRSIGPILKRKGIAVAARRSSVDLCGKQLYDEMHSTSGVVTISDDSTISEPVDDPKQCSKIEVYKTSSPTMVPANENARTIPLETLGLSISDAQEVNMEYGPCDTSDQLKDRSIGPLPMRKGIAVAARRSSVGLCGKQVYDEMHSTSGVVSKSDDSTISKTLDEPKQSSKIEAYKISSPTMVRANKNTRTPLINLDYEKINTYYHQYPSPNKAKLTHKLQKLNDDDTEISEIGDFESTSTDQLSRDYGKIRKAPLGFPSNLSIFTLDMNRCPKLPKSRCSSRSEEDGSESFSTTTAPVVVLPRRDTVVGILRTKTAVRNATRRVQFADQQPGGGRRMSLDSGSKNDSLPVRPRRSNNFGLDRLKNPRRNVMASRSGEPLYFMSVLAATKIQAVVRCWTQFKSTRLLLLSRKLVRIEENRKRDLIRIQEEKWAVLESIQSEIVDRERRLEEQVSLGEKLSDHLKRDSALVRDQTKKLQEYSHNLKKNNDHLDQCIRLHRENYSTTNMTVELLREKSDLLLTSSKKYASRLDKLQEKLELTSKQVEVEFCDKVRMRKTIKRIRRRVKQQCSAIDSPLVDSLLQIMNRDRQSDRTSSFHTITTDDFGTNSFDLMLNPHDNDMMSVFSDITHFSNGKNDGDRNRRLHNESYSSLLNQTSGSEISINFEELNRRHDVKCSGKSCGNSFASYSAVNPTLSTPKNKPLHDSNSINGNSFASYGLIHMVDTTNDGVRNNNSLEEYTPSKGMRGAAIPPRRRVSHQNSVDLTISGDFDAISEEFSDDSEKSMAT
jgi:hypothetical protein